MAPFSDDLLHDLAGNAFSATTVMNPLAALFLLFAHTRQRDGVVAMDLDLDVEMSTQSYLAMDIDLDFPFAHMDQ